MATENCSQGDFIMSANWSSSSRRGSSRASAVALSLQDTPGAWRSAIRHAEGAQYHPVSRLDLPTFSRFVIGLLIAAMIVVLLTNPSGAQTLADQNDRAASEHDRALFAQCMQDWDRATHMTTKEWARACQRVIRAREDPAQAPRQFQLSGEKPVRYR